MRLLVVLLLLCGLVRSASAEVGHTSDGTPVYFDGTNVVIGSETLSTPNTQTFVWVFQYGAQMVSSYNFLSDTGRVSGGCFMNLDHNTAFDFSPNPGTNSYQIWAKDGGSEVQVYAETSDTPGGVATTYKNFITGLQGNWVTWNASLPHPVPYNPQNFYLFLTNWAFHEPTPPIVGGGGGAGSAGPPGSSADPARPALLVLLVRRGLLVRLGRLERPVLLVRMVAMALMALRARKVPKATRETRATREIRAKLGRRVRQVRLARRGLGGSLVPMGSTVRLERLVLVVPMVRRARLSTVLLRLLIATRARRRVT